MKTSGRSLMVLIIFLLGMGTVRAFGFSEENPLAEDIQVAADSFQIAIEKHNFRMAKEQLEVLFPLIKKEMKWAKKRMQEIQKNGGTATAGQMKKALARKKEINDQIHGIVEASAAALRVRADHINSLVKEYVALVSEPDQLISANK